MSLDLQKQIWDDPDPKGTALTVLLLLASYVNHERWMRGEAALSWPSQNTIARKCNCERSTVQLALEKLQELGKIRDTGARKQRGTIVWELYPPAPIDAKTGGELAKMWEEGRRAEVEDELTEDRSSGNAGVADLPEDRSSDLTGDRSSEGDLTEDRPGRNGGGDDLTDLRDDLTDSPGNAGGDLTEDRPGTGPNLGHKREPEGKTANNNGDTDQGGRARGARHQVDGEDPAAELAEVEKLLEGRPESKMLRSRRDELVAAVAEDREQP